MKSPSHYSEEKPPSSLKVVPADVCEKCGEYYLSETTTKQVMLRAEESVKSGAEVEILRFAA